MPRNSSGSYTLPAGNPVVTGTTITSTWANSTLTDVASEITNSLDRSGRGAMLAALKIVDGSTSAPGLVFNTETTSGLSRSAAGQLSLSVLATEVLRLTSSGVTALVPFTASSTSLTVGTNLTVNGNTTLGDAAGDTLTVASSAVTWSGNPAHSGNHTFNGNLVVNGGTQLGDASGDALTVNSSSVSWPNNPAHSGNHTFNGNVGIGTAPSSFAGYGVLSINNATNGAIANFLVNGTETGRLQAFSNTFNVAAKGASSVLLFETNGSERVRIDSSGNVGVNATSPNAAGFNRAISVGTTAGQSAGFEVQRDGNRIFTMAVDSSNNGILSVSPAANMTFNVNGGERARIDSSGNVGIGIAPTSRLHIHSTTNPTLQLTDNTLGGTYGGAVRGYGSAGNGGILELGGLDAGVYTKGILIAQQATSIQFYTGINTAGNAERVRIDSAGNFIPAGNNTQNLGAASFRFADVYGVNFRDGSNGSLATSSGTTAQLAAGTAWTAAVLYTGGNERVRIDSSGNVGVAGTPDVRFHVSGSAPVASFCGSGGATSLLYGNKDSSGATGPNIFQFVNGVWLIGRGTAFTGSGGTFTEWARFDAGSLGIGKTPARPLDVNGSARLASTSVLEWGGTADYISGDSTNHVLTFGTNSTIRLTIASDGRLYGSALHNNAGAVTGTTNQYIASGTYTPTANSFTNVTAATPSTFQWIRVGNVVTVSGVLQIQTTAGANTFTNLNLSLPIASNFTNITNCAGTGARASGGTIEEPIIVVGDTTNDAVALSFYATTSSNQTASVHFTYVIL